MHKAQQLAILALLLMGCGPQPSTPLVLEPVDAVTWVRKQLATTPTELGPAAIPTALDLSLELDPTAESYRGTARWTLNIVPGSRSFRLHACAPIAVETASLRDGDNKTLPTTFEQVDCILTISASAPLDSPLWRLELEFTRPYSDADLGGLYKEPHRDSGPGLLSQTGARSARHMLPCFDEPLFKAPITLRVQAPPKYEVVANGQLESVVPQDNGWAESRFATTPPMPIYVLAVLVDQFEVLASESGRVLSHRPLRDPAFVLQHLGPLQSALERLTGLPQPYPGVDLVAVDNLLPEAMENPGVITFRRRILDVAPDDPLAKRQYMVWVMAHELSHMWFGNLVTMTWWDDIWINESFATWAATQVVRELYPELEIDTFELNRRRSMLDAALGNPPTVSRRIRTDTDNSEIFVGQVYHEGAAILEGWTRFVGPRQFKQLIRYMLRVRSDGHMDTAAFSSLLEQVAPGAGEELSRSLETPGAARVQISWRCDQGTIELDVATERHQWYGAPDDDALWSVPLCVSVQGQTEPHCQIVQATTPRITWEVEQCPEWLHPNADEAGYYVWSADAVAYHALTNHVAELSQREQAMLPYQIGQAMFSGNIPPEVGFEVLERLSTNTPPSRAFAEAFLETFELLENLPDARNSEHFAAWASTTLAGPALGGDEGPAYAALRSHRFRYPARPPAEPIPQGLLDAETRDLPETLASLHAATPFADTAIVDVVLAAWGEELCDQEDVGAALGHGNANVVLQGYETLREVCGGGPVLFGFYSELMRNPPGAQAVFRLLSDQETGLSGSQRQVLVLAARSGCYDPADQEVLRRTMLDLYWDTGSAAHRLEEQILCWRVQESIGDGFAEGLRIWSTQAPPR